MNGLTRQLIDGFLDHVIALRWLQGYRMYAGGASAVLGGLVLLLNMLAGGQYDRGTTESAVAAISLGLTVIGAAGKQDKLIEAQRAATAALQSTAFSAQMSAAAEKKTVATEKAAVATETVAAQ